MPKLENWSIVFRYDDPYLAPELQKQTLHGNVYENDRFEDGTSITTSSIKGKKGEIIITKSGTEYLLGKIDPEYEKLYPNARQRVFASIKEIE